MLRDNPQTRQDEIRPNAFLEYFRAARQKESSSPARRPWLLATLAMACAGLAVAGSLGPWMYYERVSEVAPDAWTLYGVRTDGAFTLLFAVIAFIALPIALFKAESEHITWVALAALTLCALTGLLGWLVFAPPEVSVDVGQQGNIQRVEWGMKIVGLAGAVGAITSFVIARQLNRD